MKKGLIRKILLLILLITAIVMAFYLRDKTDNYRRITSQLLELDTQKSFTGDFLASKFALRERLYSQSAAYMLQSYQYDPQNTQLLFEAFQLKWLAGNLKDANSLALQFLDKKPSNLSARLLVSMMHMKAQNFDEALSFLLPAIPRSEHITNIHQLVTYITAVWSQAGLGHHEQAQEMMKALDSTGVFTLPIDYYLGLLYDVEGNLDEAVKRYESLLGSDLVSYRIARVASNAFERHGDIDKALAIYETFREKGAVDNFDLNHEIKRLTNLKESNKANPKDTKAILKNASNGLASLLMEVISALYSKGLYSEALAYSQLAKVLAPKEYEPLLLIGLIHQEQDLCKQALNYFKQVPETSGYFYAASLNTSRCLLKLEQDHKALEILETLTKLYPDHYTPFLVQGDHYFEHEDYEEAIGHYKRALVLVNDMPLDDTWPIHYALAFAYEKSSDWQNAESILQMLHKNLPNEPEILNFLGYSWVTRNKNLDDALNMITNALETRPNDAHIIDSMGWALYTLEKYEEALPYLERAVEISSNDPTLLDHLGDLYYKLDRKREAYYQWQKALEFSKSEKEQNAIRKKLRQPDIIAISSD